MNYKTTFGPGRRDGFHPPSAFRRFMNENFVNFFVFDGELAQNLLDRRYTNAQVAVESLFQLNVFKAMDQRVEEYWKNKTKSVSATEERGLSRRQGRLQKLSSRIEQLKIDQKELKIERAEFATKLQTREDSYEQEIRKEDRRSRELREAQTNLERCKSKAREEALDILDRIRDPHALSSSFGAWLIDLKDGLDKVKLPESAAREFFEDLSKESECICGRPVTPEISEAIRSRAGQYLDTEDVSLLNSMKAVIKDSVGGNVETSKEELDECMNMLSKTSDEEREAKNELDSLQHEAEKADPAVMNARVEIDKLKSQIRDIDGRLEKFQSKDSSLKDDQTFGIEILERRIQDAERKLAEITRTLSEKKKRDILQRIIDRAQRKARDGITEELCREANQRIAELLPHNNIFIERIEKCLILQEQEGGSVGETLSIAYAFLATLFYRSDYKLPFVVDSPAGPIDLDIRPKIGGLIPNLTQQFVAFTISSERAKFIAPLKHATRSEIQFITLFRKGAVELEQIAEIGGDGDGTVGETGDGIMVVDESFFNEFQLEEEET